MSREPETFRTIYCDPGEDFGWCVGRDTKLLAAGTTKMWDAADDIWAALNDPSDPSNPLNSPDFARVGVPDDELLGPIGRIVCENWRIYPWEAHKGSLDWDECRTARVIGALTFMARLRKIPFVTQGANIKEAAVAAGAEELFYRPLKENRHQNDALMHYTWYVNVEMLKLPLAKMTYKGGQT